MRPVTPLLILLLISCSSSDGSTPDAAVADTASSIDARDAAPAPCPSTYPGDGNACTTIGSCTFRDDSCGGTFMATCLPSVGKWSSPPSTCEPYCPPTPPMPGAACKPAARACFFWPRAMDRTCDACFCVDGKWACTSPATCPFDLAACKPGTACTANTGCGAGRCNYFCACGVDGVLHCTANTC